MSMSFTDICFITQDVLRLSAFYENVFNGKAEGDEVHSVMSLDGIALTFMKEKTPAFYYEFENGSQNTIISFTVDDADVEYQRLLPLGAKMLNEPITHPWGAKSFQFKDPDGNILNFRSLPKGN
jgi:predicted enzyme related to lactoylglutathione lyase